MKTHEELNKIIQDEITYISDSDLLFHEQQAAYAVITRLVNNRGILD